MTTYRSKTSAKPRSTARKAPTAAQKAKAEAREARFESIKQQLEDGIDNLAGTEGWQSYLEVQAQFPRFSFQNTMLILIQKPDATMVMKYGKAGMKNCWVALGRYAKSGEKALYIRYPRFRVEEDEDTGRKIKRLSGFGLGPVFDVSQTEGDPLPENPIRLLDGEAPEGVVARLVAFIEAQGYTVTFMPETSHSATANGVTFWDGRVEIATRGRSTMQQLKTLIHEAGHILLHDIKLGNDLHRGIEELEAESVAFVTAKYIGLDTDGYSFGYVLHWMGGDPAKARETIKAVGARIQGAVKQIVAHIDGLTAEDEDQDETEAVEAAPVAEVVAA